MASTTAMFTGLSGLIANARSLDVIGNNIANVNTTAYKSSRLMFSTALSRTFSLGSEPTQEQGGTNPGQIGLGVSVAGTQRNFTGGTISPTGDPRDLAIEGEGFFIVGRGDQTLFTRAGAFRQNSLNELVTISGERIKGFGVDEEFNIVPGRLVDLSIPIGTMTIAEATRNVRFTGNLNSGGDLATQGSVLTFGALALFGGAPPDVNSLLVQVEDPAAPGNPLFAEGQTIEVRGVEKGSRLLPPASLAVTAASTLQDLLDFLTEALGISTEAGANPDGRMPGATLDPATGVITLVGNTGSINDLDIDLSDIRVLDAAGNIVRQPLTPTKVASADGESVRTTFVVFDSLGTPLDVDVTMVLEGRGDAGTTWRYYIESAEAAGVALAAATGVVQFDPFGQIAGAADAQVMIDRTGTGAVSPLAFTLSFASESDRVTALASSRSTLAATYQDGSPLGTLSAYAVGPDGTIVGAFDNGLMRTLGQIAMAKFANPEGLVDEGANLFSVGPNSGPAVVTTAGELGTGRIVSGALELSNVELSQEFINLILASTGYSAASRVITTTDQLFQQLLVLGR